VNKRISLIDGLRGLAVTLVLFSHLFKVPKGGFLGVDVFFVISGFIITSNINQGKYRDVKDFYFKRAKRILPPLFITLLLVFLIALVYKELFFLTYFQNIISSTLNLRFLKDGSSYNLGNIGIYSPITHLWSLSIEEQFYLLAPVLFFSKKVRGNIVISGVLVIISLLFYLINFSEFPASSNYFSSFGRLWELAFGVWLANLLHKKHSRDPLSGGISVSLSGWFALTGILVIAITLDLNSEKLRWMQLLVVLLTGWLLTLKNNALLESRILGYLGLRSYGIYLYHIPIIFFFMGIFQGLLGWIVSLLFTLALAEFSYRYLELKILKSDFSFFKFSTVLLLLFTLGTSLGFTVVKFQEPSPASQAGIYNSLRVEFCKGEFVSCQQGSTINTNASLFTCKDMSDSVLDESVRCLVKKVREQRKVLLLGDSTDLSYIPGLSHADKAYNLYADISYGCGWLYVDKNDNEIANSDTLRCNERFNTSLKYLQKIRPDMVVLSMRAQQSYTSVFINSHNNEIGKISEQDLLIKYYRDSISEIRKYSKVVMIVAPPNYLYPINCQHPKNPGDLCEGYFKDIAKDRVYQDINLGILKEVVKESKGVVFLDANDYTCFPSSEDCRWENVLGQSRASQVHLPYWLSFYFGKFLNEKIVSSF